MPSGPSTPAPMAPQEGASPVPSPNQPTRRPIRLSSPERERLSSLNLTPDPEEEAPPKPPRSCSALARQALEGSFVGWGVPTQTPQGNCSVALPDVLPGEGWGGGSGVPEGECQGTERAVVDARPWPLLCPVLMAMEEEGGGHPSSSDEDEDNDEDDREPAALDPATEQVRGETAAYPTRPGGTCSVFPQPCSCRVFTQPDSFIAKLPSLLPAHPSPPAQVPSPTPAHPSALP